MTRLTDYINKRVNHPDQFNAVTPQPKSELPDHFVQAPQNTEIDTTDALGSLVGMLVPPHEREAQERRLLEHRNKMQMWFGLFDGLRQLGNLYATAKGASPQNLTSTAPVIDQQYEQQRQFINGLGNYRNSYAQQLYNLHRQNEADKRAKESHDADMSWKKTHEELAREESRRKDEYNEARIEQAKAIAENNFERAKYWELKAEGVPDETAARIAKDYAAAEKNRQQGNAAVIRANNAGGSNKTNKNKKSIPGYQTSGNGGSSTGSRGNLY